MQPAGLLGLDNFHSNTAMLSGPITALPTLHYRPQCKFIADLDAGIVQDTTVHVN